MKPSPTQSQQAAGSVSVSIGSQKWVVGSLAAMALVQAGFVVIMYGSNSDGATSAFLLSYLSFTAFPIIVFALAFFITPSYDEKINRWFVAALRTLVVAAIFGTLQSLKGYSFTWLTNKGQGQTGAMPPSWITSTASDYVILGLCILGFVYSIYRNRKNNTYGY